MDEVEAVSSLPRVISDLDSSDRDAITLCE
jgi:hypothetical protein